MNKCDLLTIPRPEFTQRSPVSKEAFSMSIRVRLNVIQNSAVVYKIHEKCQYQQHHHFTTTGAHSERVQFFPMSTDRPTPGPRLVDHTTKSDLIFGRTVVPVPNQNKPPKRGSIGELD